MHSFIFDRAQIGGGGVAMWHTAATAFMFYLFFSFLFETFPNTNALTRLSLSKKKFIQVCY